MSNIFELRFQQLGNCVSELSTQTQYLQELLGICLQDYNEMKSQETNIIAQYIESAKLSNSTPYSRKNKRMKEDINCTSNEQNIVSNNISELSSNELLEQAKNEIKEEDLTAAIKQYTATTNQQEVIPTSIKRASTDNNISYAYTPYENSCDIVLNNQLLPIPNSYYYSQSINSDSGLIQGRSRKKPEIIFKTLSREEKERILLDNFEFGNKNCERKWGVNRTMINRFFNTKELFTNEQKKETWMSIKKNIILDKMSTMQIEIVVENVIGCILRCMQNIDNKYFNTHNRDQLLLDLCNLSFDRGIAIAASRYSINLFELEFLLQHLYPSEWLKMKNNNWYCVGNNGLRNDMSKLDIVELSKAQGIVYASKKSGKGVRTICVYRRIFEDQGAEGLMKDNYERSKKRELKLLEINKGVKKMGDDKGDKNNMEDFLYFD